MFIQLTEFFRGSATGFGLAVSGLITSQEGAEHSKFGVHGRCRGLFIRTVIYVVVTASLCLSTQRMDAQTVGTEYRYPPRIQWSEYDPYYSITSHVYAQAELIRAQGDAAIRYSEARILDQEAYSKGLDNWYEERRVYWDRKIMAEKKKLELGHVKQIKRMKFLNDKKWANSRIWEKLKYHTELSAGQIRGGSALNFLLKQLANSDSLPYRYEAQNSHFGDGAIDELTIDDDWLGYIRLKQGAFTFAANESVKEQISDWPYVLRWDEFELTRSAFERARAIVIEEADKNGQVSVAAIERLDQALMALTDRFHRSDKVDQWVKEQRRFSQFHASDRFLRDLDREVVRLQNSGDIRPFQDRSGYDPDVDGDHLISLLSFMNRNGLEFAPAQPGGEFAYHNLFVKMRALYLTVAEEDESLVPKNLATEAEK